MPGRLIGRTVGFGPISLGSSPSPAARSEATQAGIELYLSQAGIELYPPSQLMAKFYYVYILNNKQKNFIYIGYSENLKQRIEDHNKGRSTSTKKYTPLELIHHEAYCDKIDAKRRERYLKTNRGKTTLKTMLQNHLTK